MVGHVAVLPVMPDFFFSFLTLSRIWMIPVCKLRELPGHGVRSQGSGSFSMKINSPLLRVGGTKVNLDDGKMEGKREEDQGGGTWRVIEFNHGMYDTSGCRTRCSRPRLSCLVSSVPPTGTMMLCCVYDGRLGGGTTVTFELCTSYVPDEDKILPLKV